VLLGYAYVTEEAEHWKKQGSRGRGFDGSSEKIINFVCLYGVSVAMDTYLSEKLFLFCHPELVSGSYRIIPLEE